ncbi:MAG: hypothetical protein ACXVI3_03010 [Halobacteriota archaeon]
MTIKEPTAITPRPKSARARVQPCSNGGLEPLVGRDNLAPLPSRVCGDDKR